MGKMFENWKWALLVMSIPTWIACTKTSASSSLSSFESVGGGSTDSLSDVTLEDINTVSLSGGSATLNLTPSSDYLLIVNSDRSGSNMTVQLSQGATTSISSKKSSIAALNFEPSLSAQDKLDLEMRNLENTLYTSETPLDASNNPNVAALQPLLSVGSTRSFKSLSSLSSISNYDTFDATLVYSSSSLYVYIDNRNLTSVSQTSIDSLATDFEDIAVPVEHDLFGFESDVDDDGHVTILMTQVVNGLSSSGGLITGYFFPGDLFAASSSNPASNEMEIFYTLVPDPAGDHGIPISESFTVGNVLPGVLAHEFQHMISYNQKVFLQAGSTEEPWLNEGLSHFAEDITGFGNENPARERIFLANPSQISIAPSSSPSLGQRGGAYLFVRYLYEQSSNGTQFIQHLYNSNNTGTANIEHAFAGTSPSLDQFNELMNQWAIALALSETGLTSDARYSYETRTINSQTGNYMGVCIRCDAQDGRGTVLSGPTLQRITSFPTSSTVGSASSQIYRLVAPSGSIQLSTGSSSAQASLIELTPRP